MAYAYSWQRDGSDIVGATEVQYTLGSGDVNQAITCMVVATNGSGSGIAALSLPVIPGSGSGGIPGEGPGGGTSTGSSGGSAHAGARSGAPALAAFSVSPRRMAIVGRGRRWSSRGLTFRFTTDRGAEVVIVIERQRPRAALARCRAVRHRRRRSCARYVEVRTLTVAEAGAGAHSRWWAGRAARRFLASGRYLAYAAAVTSGGWSATRVTSFAVVRRRR